MASLDDVVITPANLNPIVTTTDDFTPATVAVDASAVLECPQF